MDNLKTYKKLATEYFQGKISRADEKVLLDFVSISEENQEMFREWEEEWGESIDSDELADPDISIFREKRKAIDKELVYIKKQKRLQLITYFSIAASLALLLGFGSLYIRNVTTSSNKTATVFEVKAPIGGKCQTVLPDGSIVWLNADSRIEIPSSFSDEYRRVALYGEAYFEVHKDTGNEFSVITDGCSIVVHGTKFNVSAYTDDETISTAVIEGNVSVISKDTNVNISAGQAARYSKASSLLEVTDLANSRNHAWVENRIDYKDITLYELSRVIARKYGKTIVFVSDTHVDERFNISLRNNESVDDLLEALKLILGIDIKKQDNKIYIK